MVERPFVIAHRGFSGRYPENSLLAVQQAIGLGVDYVEVDVQQTADGEIVVFHDVELRRLCGVAGRIHQIAYEKLLRSKADVPTLREVLLAAKGRCRVLVEIKRADPLRVANIVEECGMTKDADLFSFSVAFLQTLAEAKPHLRLFGLIGDELNDGLKLLKASIPVAGIAIGNRLLDSRRTVGRIRRSDWELFVWTVNRVSRMRQLLEWGVNGIITNHPDRLLTVLTSLGPTVPRTLMFPERSRQRGMRGHH